MSGLVWPILGIGTLVALALKDFNNMVNSSDWIGWVWPVPITDGRIPTISDGWHSKRDGGSRLHLGVDIMFEKRAGDPREPVRHIASRRFIVPPGTVAIASGPGKIWSTNSTRQGKSILIDHGSVGSAGGVTTFYQHLSSFSRIWKKGDVVSPGTVLGIIGHSLDDGEQLDHLHFEMAFPRKNVDKSKWQVDPATFMRYWTKTVLQKNCNVA